ncbi:MAG: AMP-binding protein [Candidatus Korobacteraceae bacterium]
MTFLLLSSRIRHALADYGERTVIEAADGKWRLTGAQLLGGADLLLEALQRHADRPLIAYLHKSPLYYAFITCSFLNHLDFCPLDTDNPIERVLDVASQLAGALILCDSDKVLAQLRDRTEHCIKIDLSFEDVKCHSTNGEGNRAAYEASYYIATSGSTGLPKLVEVPHDRTIPFIEWAIPFYGICHSSRWAQFSSIGFDLSLADFLSVVCGGGTLISLFAQLDRIRPAKAVLRSGITHWHSVPSMIPYFLRESGGANAGSTCRLFTFCGEPLMKTDADRLAERYPNARIVNTYGPTEATLFCSFFEYEVADSTATETSLPIGQPIPSWNFVLLPEEGVLRLIILSDNLSNGYVGLRSPSFSTADLFGRKIRAFDTGDFFKRVGRHLYFSHRKDGMVKINGNRIDLGEIEAVAKRTGLVNPVAVVIKNTIIVVAEHAAGDTPELMTELCKYLPRTSLPAAIRFVGHHPRTVNGKLDRRAIQGGCGDIDEP